MYNMATFRGNQDIKHNCTTERNFITDCVKTAIYKNTEVVQLKLKKGFQRKSLAAQLLY